MRRARSLHWLLFIAWCLGLTWLLYGAALALPFFFDDFVHYPFVQANTVAEIWRTTDELAYYRPLNFTIWRLTYELFARHNPVVDHGINLLLHALNGVLVGWLAARLWMGNSGRFPVVVREDTAVDWARCYLAATLFLLFPFSYQAVPWVGSLSHLLVTALILLSLGAYVKMRRSRQRLWGVASLLFALLAPFAHENGVLVMPFIVLIELTTPGARDRWRRAVQSGIIWSLPLLAWLPLWLTLPRVDAGGLFPNNVEGLLQNSAYFTQGVFYPLTALGGWLRQTYGVNDMVAVVLLSGLGLIIALFVQITQGATLRSLLPWLWVALASAPAIVSLVFDYVINGPRLLMVVSVGVAWLWADVALLFARGGRSGSGERAARTAVTGVALALVLLLSVTFVRERMALHTVLGRGFWAVVDAATEANEAGETAVVVNFPSWLAPQRATFALGHEGVLFWPDYVPPGMLLAVHTGDLGALQFVRVDAIRPNLESFYYGPTGPPADWPAIAAAPSRVFMTQYRPEAVQLMPAGALGPTVAAQAAAEEPFVAQFVDAAGAPQATLHAARAQASPAGMRVDLVWEVERPLPDVTVFTHLLDAGGQLVAQADGEPLAGSYPFLLWQAGDVAHDIRWAPLADAEALTVRVGLYNRVTGERLTAVGPDGTAWGDGVGLTPVATTE